MTSLEAYQSLLEKVNRTDTNSNIHVPRGRFVNLYNQQRLIWLSDKLREYKASQKLDELSDLLEDDVELNKVDNRRDHARFTLPSDFFEFSSSYSLCSKGDCTERPVVNWEMKSSNKQVLLNDSNHNPSFEYEETLALINKGMLSVFFSDFSVDKCFLTYYRSPNKIDLVGYVKLDGSPSETVDPELPDEQVDEILDYCYTELMRANKDVEGFQLAKDKKQ